ncbi:biliverdin-producing heme oxygenase [Vreelandella sp.]|uniref:biliverdin-producing heme oxygenase n=1 Tax=Vreelandella sp. TaxID=3137778 RepID=UPI003BAAC2B2
MSLAQLLRQGTLADHRQVDHHAALRDLLRPEVSLEHYGAALACLYPAIAGLEHALSHASKRHPSYTLTLREPLLRDDVQRLHQPVLPAWGFAAPANVYEWVGMLYVLEGSRLGGEVIARHTQGCLGEQIPSRFFTQTPLTPAAWAGFWRFAEATCPKDAWPVAVKGARDAFQEFTEALTNALPVMAPRPLALAPTE